jgi:hypothetical protein
MKQALIIALGLFLLLGAGESGAQSKIIRKTVTKVITPQITPAAPPKTNPTEEVKSEVPPPPPQPDYEIKTPKENRGLFGWGLNTDIGANVLSGNGSLVGIRGDIVFSDPLKFGEKFGLAEDAVEYKLGLGFGSSGNSFTIPMLAEATAYLKEGSLFGLDPFVGTGLIYNLAGTQGGGLGGQIYLGFLNDFGFGSGKTGISLGYATYNIGTALSVNGIQLTVSQPIKF